MNRTLLLINIVALLLGTAYGMHGPVLPVFAKNVIGASYAELGFIGLANFLQINVICYLDIKTHPFICTP